MANLAKAKNLYDWDDYRSWTDNERYEIINGELFNMSPAPTPRHQIIQQKLSQIFGEYFDGKPCQVLPSPIDVKLSNYDIVQPDIVIVCKPEQITRTHIEGAPALVVEILSKSTALYDRIRKLQLYAKSGIKEVWLVTPYPHLVEVLLLDGASYRIVGAYTRTDKLKSPTFPDMKIALDRVFNFPLEPGEDIVMIKEPSMPYSKKG